jgi:hypothetical protein
MKKTLVSLLFVLGFTAATQQANAAAILSYGGDLTPYDLSIQLDIQTPARREVGAISGAIFVADGSYRFEALCIEIEQDPWFTNPYTSTLISTSDVRFTNLAKLYGNWYTASKADATKFSAFATVLREIQYDSGNGLNLSGGTFKVNSAPASVLSYANQIVSSLLTSNAPTPAGWQFVVWGNPVDQDLLEARAPSNVPAPGTLAILGLGVFALVGASRSLSAKSLSRPYV